MSASGRSGSSGRRDAGGTRDGMDVGDGGLVTTAAPPGGDPTDARSVATVPGLLAASAERAPDALALLAPGSAPLTYRRLREQVEETARTLAALGLGRGDRVALVLPDGP